MPCRGFLSRYGGQAFFTVQEQELEPGSVTNAIMLCAKSGIVA